MAFLHKESALLKYKGFAETLSVILTKDCVNAKTFEISIAQYLFQ